MEDLLYLLVFLFFFVILPMLQRVRGKGKAPQRSRRPEPAGGTDAPSPSIPPTYDEDPSYDDEAVQGSSSPQRAKQRTAEDVLPDDLWQILTGEKRPPQRTEPEPFESDYEPASAGDVRAGSEQDNDGERAWEDVSAETPTRWEPELEPEQIPVPVPVPRRVRLPEPTRPTRVGGRTPRTGEIGAGSQPAALTRGPNRRLNIALHLDSRDDLRRAMILREVLGPPKGLQ